MSVYLLDYGAGNVRSVVNAAREVGYEVRRITCAEDFELADKLIFPGVGSFGSSMKLLSDKGYFEPLKKYIESGKPYFGICIGMQALFNGSEESPGVDGLGVIDSEIKRFPTDLSLSVPHIGWNGVNVHKPSCMLQPSTQEKFYFVHSYMAPFKNSSNNNDNGSDTNGVGEWTLATTDYGVEFVSAVCKGNVFATQFHPEKSGASGLALFKRFLSIPSIIETPPFEGTIADKYTKTRLAPRVIACLDVRANDQGDLVVTKGDQYDVREKESKNVRNLGKPVELAGRYYKEGADEITFLNITSFRDSPLKDQPMLEVLRKTSEHVFVPLTVGGGIRDIVEPNGERLSALQVATEYFRSGADKVSIGSDAVAAALEYIQTGQKTNKTSIETISHVYGAQAVVISVDPKRVYVSDPNDTKHHTIQTAMKGPNGEEFCWYQCTVKGGREAKDIGAYELVRACEALGAGEILLNCMDKDGTNNGYDHELISDIVSAVSIPVIASSGAGKVEHFSACLRASAPSALLAAGIFHRREIPISAVKQHLNDEGFDPRE
eukprot:m.153430 g.153430  ORF g.153430 m.153430 type:complete len:549 (+) comp13308_c1_seq1:87-1733(+)